MAKYSKKVETLGDFQDLVDRVISSCKKDGYTVNLNSPITFLLGELKTGRGLLSLVTSGYTVKKEDDSLLEISLEFAVIEEDTAILFDGLEYTTCQ